MIESLLPEQLPLFVAAILVVASFFTSATTAAFGIGGGLLLLSIMAYLVPPIVLIPVHGVVQLGSNGGRAWLQRRHIQWNTLWPFFIGCTIGAAIGSQVATQLPEDLLKIILALFVLVFAWVKLPALGKASRSILALGGLGTSFATMFVGATGPLVAVLFKDLFEDRMQLVASLATAMTSQHVFKVLAFSVAGFAFFDWVPLMLGMIATGYLGTISGTFLLNRFDETFFRRAFKVTLTVVALDLLRRGVLAYF